MMKPAVQLALLTLLGALTVCAPVHAGDAAQTEAHKANVEFFENKIRPVLIAACYKCHSSEPGNKIKGGLVLDTRAGLLKGGDTGPAVVPGDPGKSLLMKAIRYEAEDLEMPPTDKLTPQQIADFETWIKNGASDPRIKAVVSPPPIATMDIEKGRAFWSFQPVKEPAIPSLKDKAWPKNPIDHFILAKLEEKNIRPAPAADKRTLLRRTTFDLTGLPPTPADIDAFLADNSPQAFEKVLDRLLASKHYGEAWGRHWLDIARYADTAGESADYPIPQAYLYRNYVIDSFNRDKPYDQFIREQIAGDLMPAATDAEKHEKTIATGFVALSRRFSVDPDHAHHLTIEDTIDTMGRAVLGLTLSCARCHDHKFDPIPTLDYYSLFGIFNSTRYPFPGCEVKQYQRDFVPLATPEQLTFVKELEAQIAVLRKESEKIEKDHKAVEAEADPSGATKPELPATAKGDLLVPADYTKAFRLGSSPEQAVSEIVPVEGQPFTSALSINTKKKPPNPWEVQITAQTVFPIESGDILVATFHARLPKAKDKTESTAELIIESNGPQYEPILQQTIKIGAAWKKYEFPLVAPKNLLAEKAQVNLRLGHAAQIVEMGGMEVKNYKASLAGTDYDKFLRGSKRDRINAFKQQLEEKKKQIAENQVKAEKIPRAYALSEGTPQHARVQIRGEPGKLGDEAKRGFIQVLGGQKLPATLKASGRLELAGWLTDPKNPLTSRVMVNRMWQYHFGKGLVQTPSDFGKQGRAPTHPELLDFLALRFVESGWSMKAMHKWLMLSQTYQLASQYPAGEDKPEYSNADGNNELLRKFNRRRLDAEEIRDSLLSISGALDLKPAEAHPFTPASKWKYTQHDQFFAVYDTKKRSVYVMQQRQRRHPFFATFDGADTNQTTAVRLISTTPLQALFMMNDKFTHEIARTFTTLLLAEKDEAREMGKTKTLSGEKNQLAAWSGLARVIFSSNEFLFVD